MVKQLVAAAAVVLCIPSPGRAQGDQQLRLMEAMHGLMAGPGAAGSQAPFVVAAPGVAVDSWDELTGTEAAAITSRLDSAPSRAWLSTWSGRTVADVYAQILETSEWAVSALDAGQRRELAAINAELYSDVQRQIPKPDYRKYLDLKRSLDELTARLEATPEEQRTAQMREALRAAAEDLRLKGDQVRFERLLGRRELLAVPSPQERRDGLRGRLAQHAEASASGTYYPVSPNNDVGELLNDTDWTTFEFSVTPSARIEPGHVAPEPGWAMWRFDDSSGATHTFAPTAVTRASIRMEARVVPLDRPWLDEGVLADRIWRWPPGHPPVSGGDTAASGELMPLLPTHVLLVRHVEVQGDFSAAELRALRDRIRAGQASSWGPFATSGRYLQSPEERFFAARRLRRGFAVDEVQIVGWYCTVVARAPDPDERLEWK